VVDILDRGPGIDASPSSHGGLGLGLAIAHGFAAANEVTLELTGRSGGGTRARLSLAAEPLPAGVAA
jgi:K+-sensing histidine kinase KdpD